MGGGGGGAGGGGGGGGAVTETGVGDNDILLPVAPCISKI